jgi:lipopolysaccharide biosynthesis protein WzzE
MGRKKLDSRYRSALCTDCSGLYLFCSSGVERDGDYRPTNGEHAGGYYSQQQFLRNLDIKANLVSVDQPSVMDEAYKEFIMQQASWDTRRDFWLQTDYYKQRQSGNARADAALLDDLINDIQFMPGDALKSINDSVKLTAETAPDANNLLRQYVAFASQRAAGHLNDELKGAWAARTVQMKAQVKRQEEVAREIFNRRMHSVEQALKVAQQHNISRSETDIPPDQLPDSELFLLGRPMLQARLENLQAVGPQYDLDYDQSRAMLNDVERWADPGSAFSDLQVFANA